MSGPDLKEIANMARAASVLHKAFCATGDGGGIDNSCGSDSGSSGAGSGENKYKVDLEKEEFSYGKESVSFDDVFEFVENKEDNAVSDMLSDRYVDAFDKKAEEIGGLTPFEKKVLDKSYDDSFVGELFRDFVGSYPDEDGSTEDFYESVGDFMENMEDYVDEPFDESYSLFQDNLATAVRDKFSKQTEWADSDGFHEGKIDGDIYSRGSYEVSKAEIEEAIGGEINDAYGLIEDTVTVNLTTRLEKAGIPEKIIDNIFDHVGTDTVAEDILGNLDPKDLIGSYDKLLNTWMDDFDQEYLDLGASDRINKIDEHYKSAGNVRKKGFCPTGEGGGVDNSCGNEGGSSSGSSSDSKPQGVSNSNWGRAKKIAGKVLAVANAAPTFAREVAKEAGASDTVANLAYTACTFGDWGVPGVPAASAVVIGLSSIKKPTAVINVAKKRIEAFKKLRKKGYMGTKSENLTDEQKEALMKEILKLSDNDETWIAVYLTARDEMSHEDAVTFTQENIDEIKKESESE